LILVRIRMYLVEIHRKMFQISEVSLVWQDTTEDSLNDFFKISKPMTELLEKGRTFEWMQRYETSFPELKIRLTTAPVLTMPDMEKLFSIYCNASGQGLGCVLMQDNHVGICFKKVKETRREVPDS
jgi:hypothetical protein